MVRITPQERRCLQEAHAAVGNDILRIIEFMRRVIPQNDVSHGIYHGRELKGIKRRVSNFLKQEIGR
jgi:hypothetical protein